MLLPAENFRYAPDFARVREWVLAGAIGRPLLAHWQSVRAYDPFGKYVRTEWRQKPAHPGGYMSDAGVHYVDVLRATLGEVDTLYATMIHNWPILGSYDTAVIAMRTVSGTPCALVLSWAAAESRDRGLEIFGSEGTITANREEVSLRRPGSPTERFAPAQSEGFLEEFIDFHLAITEGKCPLMTPDEAYRDLAVMIAAIQSAQTKQAIDFAAFLAAHACPEAS